MGKARLIPFPGDDPLAVAAADLWVDAIARARAAGRKHLVALSGGRVAKKFFIAAAQLAASREVGFEGVEFFWADERCVPPDDPESNYLLANEHLFKSANIAASAIHRIEGELDPAIAATRAAAELSRIAGQGSAMPALDLVVLGMGEDGHVASLFPMDSRTGSDSHSVFLPVENSPKPPSKRVTLGHGAIAAAREVWVLASGSAKQAALLESLRDGGVTPLAEVIRRRISTKIFLDIEL